MKEEILTAREETIGAIILLAILLAGFAALFLGLRASSHNDMQQLDAMIKSQNAACTARGGTLIVGSVVVIPLPKDYKFPCVKSL